jgi:hypothetical protein
VLCCRLLPTRLHQFRCLLLEVDCSMSQWMGEQIELLGMRGEMGCWFALTNISTDFGPGSFGVNRCIVVGLFVVFFIFDVGRVEKVFAVLLEVRLCISICPFGEEFVGTVHTVHVKFFPNDGGVGNIGRILVAKILPGFLKRFDIVKLIEAKDNVVVPHGVIPVLVLVVMTCLSLRQEFVVGGIRGDVQGGGWIPAGYGRFGE